jgi:hypothetical protein
MNCTLSSRKEYKPPNEGELREMRKGESVA